MSVSVSVSVTVNVYHCVNGNGPFLTDRMGSVLGSVPILPVKRTVTIDVMLYFDGDGQGHGEGDG